MVLGCGVDNASFGKNKSYFRFNGSFESNILKSEGKI